MTMFIMEDLNVIFSNNKKIGKDKATRDTNIFGKKRRISDEFDNDHFNDEESDYEDWPIGI